MPGNRNPGARQRAEDELRADPYRSNYLIAEHAKCTPQRVSVWRRQLEAAGLIEQVPLARRAAQPRPLHIASVLRGRELPCATRDAIALLGTSATPRQVADAAGVSIQAAWTMLRKCQPKPVDQRVGQHADLAAASDSISVTRTLDLEQIRFRRELARRNARRAAAGMARLDTRQPARPCQPPDTERGVRFSLGWPVPSEAAARLCANWCPVEARCPVSLASWTAPIPGSTWETPERRRRRRLMAGPS